MYKKEIKTKKFPCDFCFLDTCPLNARQCPANTDIKLFLHMVPPEEVMLAYEEYLRICGLGILKI